MIYILHPLNEEWKMKNRKIETFVYEGLGFPITLIKVPMKKVFGEWILDIDMTQLQLVAFRALAFKPTRLTRHELQFIRKFLVMTTVDFGRAFGVSHVSVVKWENGQRRISPSTEFCIRLYMLNHLRAKDKEFRNLYNEVSLEKLSKGKTEKISPLEIDVSDNFKIAL